MCYCLSFTTSLQDEKNLCSNQNSELKLYSFQKIMNWVLLLSFGAYTYTFFLEHIKTEFRTKVQFFPPSVWIPNQSGSQLTRSKVPGPRFWFPWPFFSGVKELRVQSVAKNLKAAPSGNRETVCTTLLAYCTHNRIYGPTEDLSGLWRLPNHQPVSRRDNKIWKCLRLDSN